MVLVEVEDVVGEVVACGDGVEYCCDFVRVLVEMGLGYGVYFCVCVGLRYVFILLVIMYVGLFLGVV